MIVASCSGSGPGEIPLSCPDANYPAWENSKFVLPYPVGEGYSVLRGNCAGSEHEGDIRFSYDFDMPVGSSVTAARLGVVKEVVEDFENFNGEGNGVNKIEIQHSDNSRSSYENLDKSSALVRVGQFVREGEIIAKSGASGLNHGETPHLHFHVLDGITRETRPVTFRNTEPNPDGLLTGSAYFAEPFVPEEDPRENCAGVNYPTWESSLYVLPYRVGEAYLILQGNCTDSSHQNDIRFGYDFRMPIGTTIIAARSGKVEEAVEEFENYNGGGNGANIVIVRHADGTRARYGHLDQNGVFVEVGQIVHQGDVIARSGASNLTEGFQEAHLHFHVQKETGTETLPSTFRNTSPNPNGLLIGGLYEAKPFTPEDK
ncbi:Murein DD-endopeptidase MepM and murein hydrolase activator NlpD, contain LysM domain [Fodinibius roseus]|uniref:Murein DD-endopeptidase MepM and murein hydrolase activator NlpD, contain LysM domain n=2 Tax=Fodinibius roseus TaxID=1194090 RepID=A0A1M5B8R8_9BACT|nr:Murein DD-endopeptidase MepM and murein hydrolase activator NlpD, contain LysM domain [Fodinibius roseus]